MEVIWFALIMLSGLTLLVIYSIISECKAKRLLKQRACVEDGSEWVRAVKELTAQIHYYDDIPNNGHSKCSVEVNSKAKFDKTAPSTGLYEAIRDNRFSIENALDHIRRNRVIDEMYRRNIQRLRTAPTQQQCEEIGITIDRFQEWENEMVEEIRLRIPVEYAITCYVRYTSPQGRNHYSKQETIGEAEIQEYLQRLDSENALHASEAWRRKTERSKVTPAVRFRIIQRDGGRCRVCGRTAQDGIELEVDHIIPISHGGDSRDSNLQTLCRECNRGKGSTEYTLS